MEQVNAGTLVEIGRERSGPCLSLFLKRGASIGGVSQSDGSFRARLKQLSHAGQLKLVQRGMSAQQARRMIRPVRQIAGSAGVWTGASGLAVYSSTSEFRVLRLCHEVPDEVAVGNRFLIRPLLPLLEQERSFFVLAVSRGRAFLVRSDGDAVGEVDVPGMPPSMDSVSQFDRHQTGVQFYSRSATPSARGGVRFHGHDEARQEQADAFARYVREISEAVSQAVEKEGLPCIMAAPQEIFSAMQREARIPGLLATGIHGNVDRLSPWQLAERGRQIMAVRTASARADVMERYADARGRSGAVTGLRPVLSAAYKGQVRDLFVSPQSRAFGYFDTATMEVTSLPPGMIAADDLVDLAAFLTLQHGGAVHTVLPSELSEATLDEQIAATVRPPVHIKPSHSLRRQMAA